MVYRSNTEPTAEEVAAGFFFFFFFAVCEHDNRAVL